MGLFDHFPYTNVHELNLDWILSMMKALEAEWEAFTAGNSLQFADPMLHDISKTYAKNTIVLDGNGNAYVSLQAVPVGVGLQNGDYWLMVFDYEAFIEKVNKNFTVRYYRGSYRATAAMAIGDWLTVDDILYKATAAIAVDDILEDGVNITHFTLEDFIKAFMQSANQLIQQFKNDIDASELLYRQQLAQDIATTTASLQAQLDAVIAGATVDSEVIDARTGYDATSYASLGTAIRSQVGDIHYAATINNDFNAIFEVGGLSGSDGSEVSNNTAVRSDFIRFPSTKLLFNNTMTYDGDPNDYMMIDIFKYNLDGTFISHTGTFNEPQVLEIDTTKKYRLLIRHRVNGTSATMIYPASFTLLNNLFFTPEDDNIIELNNLLFKIIYDWEDGSLSTSDGSETSNNYRVRTKYMNFGVDATIAIKNPLTSDIDSDDYLQLMFFEYDSSLNFNITKSLRSWTSKDIIKFDVKKDCYYRMQLGHRENGANAAIHVANDMSLISNITIVRAQMSANDAAQISNTITSIDNQLSAFMKNSRAAVLSFAHQGYHTNYVKNTAKAIEAAGEHGFIGSQFNLRRTSDNIGVIHHDNTIYVNPNTFKITNILDPDAVSYDIDQHTYADLSQYTYDNAYDQTQKIPTLDEILYACKVSGIVPYILSGGMAQAFLDNVIPLIHKYAFERVAYIAGNWAKQVLDQELIPGCKVEIVDNTFPDINTEFISPSGTYHYLYEYAQNGGVAGLNIQLSAYTLGTRDLDIAYIQSLHEIGITTSISIINNSSDYELIAPHSDRMISDDLMFSNVF